MQNPLLDITRTNEEFSTTQELRKTGIDFISEVSWGTHLSLFYETQEDLLTMLVPYFKAGLENNEFCIWITSILSVNDAIKAMRRAIPDFDRYLFQGQIEIRPHTDWYLNNNGEFDVADVLDKWVSRLDTALSTGYEGMILSGDTIWLEKKNWTSFEDYEREVHAVIRRQRIIAFCTYSLSKCKTQEIINTCKHHQFAIVKQKDIKDIIFN